MSTKRSVTLSQRDKAIAGSFGLSAEERRLRALRIEHARAGVSEEELEEVLVSEAEEAEAIEQLDGVKVSADARQPLSKTKRAKLRSAFGINVARRQQAPERKKHWVQVVDDVSDALEFLMENNSRLNGWERDFVRSVVDFVTSNEGLTTKQWNTTQAILKKLQYRL